MPEASDPFLNPDLHGRGPVTLPGPMHAADACVLGASLVMLLWGVGSYGLYEPHEGHFAGVGREMVLTGNWTTPHLNGSPYLNKPPLQYWSIALCNLLFGINEFSARLPSVLYGWLGVVLAWRWASRVFGRQAGRAAAAMLTVSAGWFLFTHQAMIEILLATLTLWSLYALWKALQEPARRGHWLGFYLLLALALLAKGPVAVLFPLLCLLGYLALRKRWSVLAQAGLWWGVPLMLLPAAAWALLVERECPGFIWHAVWNEMYMRIFNKRDPPDYTVSQIGPLGYLGVTAAWCTPWTLLAGQAFSFAWKTAFTNSTVKEPAAQARRDAVLLWLLGALVPVLIFLPMPSRLIYYSIPASAPFALLVSGWWTQVEKGAPARTYATAAILLLLAGAGVFSAGFWIVEVVRRIPDLAAAPETLELMPRMTWIFGAGLLTGGLFFLCERPRAGLAWICLFCSAAWLGSGAGFRSFEDVRSSKRLVAELDSRIGPDAVWVAEGSYELGASAAIGFYLGTDELGQPRTVRVMVDDPRRRQPQFGQCERRYAFTRQELFALWNSGAPAVFVTDHMRRSDATEDEPLYFQDEQGHCVRGVERLGEPLPWRYGFRRVYANAAAKERLKK